MAAPMREGAPAGGARPAPHAHPANFEYDDNEWDIGIGDLIIDLDADIEKTDEAGGMAARAEPDAQRTALKMKIKRTKPGTKSSEAKHEIVKSNEMNGEPKPTVPAATAPPAAAKRGSGGHRRDKARDKHHHPHPPHDVNGVARVPPPPNAPGPPAPQPPAPMPPALAATPAPPKPEQRPASAPRLEPKPPAPSAPAPATPAPAPPPAPTPPQHTPHTQHTPTTPSKPEPDDSRQQDTHTSQPPAKKIKTDSKETAEVCVGTSVGTITEPDCLGPCEPGTSVTLEGIVWHETEGGVLVVNVTWRGKTYVGTLLDCTRHDWAPPRFCDSPTEELDARTPKGRGAKRGRNAAPTDMTNFTETRSSVHSKLRNGGAKGRRALPSPTPFTPPRPDSKRKRTSEAEERPPTPKAKRPPPTPSSPPPDPVLLECPEPNCSKKYKHANGLKYHRSHAHGAPDDDDKDGSSSEQEEPAAEPASPARPPSEPATPATPVKSPTPAKSPEAKTDKSPEKSPEKPETEAESPQTPRFAEDFSASAETPAPVERPQTPPQPPATPPDALPTLQPTQFKVKPRSALMAEERKSTESPAEESPGKRRARRSPTPGVRSPAYSDISDDAAPPDAPPDTDPAHRPFPVYHQYYGQPSYMPPSHPPTAPPPSADKTKDDLSKGDPKSDHKDGKPDNGPQKVLPQHFYPYNYVPNFPYNVEAGGPPPGAPLDDKSKDNDRSKTTPSPLDKSKQRPPDGKENPARPNDNHQILKESIEMKAQMGPYAFQRPPHAREEELRRYDYFASRYYMSLDQRRKEGGNESKPPGVAAGASAGQGGRPPPQPAHKQPPKDKDDKPKEEVKVKQEGQKPTTETQGPPPPPTSQYYLPPYMQAPHYGALPFDPVYRAPLSPMLVGGFGGGWTVPRYHAPEDLSRPPAGKLELLPGGGVPPAPHAAFPYGAAPHKIHELQEHAKSPGAKPRPDAPKEPAPAGREPRSPPPMRHVHTHHHTHVGLGYPLYPPPYPAAAVLASTQAVVNSFPTPPK
ncbi:uncharacterized protein LOC142979732 isoform X1 [Anticarsia gemmatalis]|uniref:uncharacterized protein LOC142979732 isoform X1 n=1 Tax=Anticarsia gemmatalis TaxID=129554 RepID=UPI003F75B6E0